MASNERPEYSISNCRSAQSRGFASLWFMIAGVLLGAEEVGCQPTRIEQFYPNSGTITPYTFGYHAFNGFYLADYTVYVHGELDATAPSVRAIRKDGFQVEASATNARSSYNLNFYSNSMVSFGQNQEISKFNFQYIYPGFFIFDNSFSASHNLDFYMARVDLNSGIFFVSTQATHLLFKYAFADLTASAGQQLFADVAAFSVINFFAADRLLLAGTDAFLKIADKSNLAEVHSFLSACQPTAEVVNFVHDGEHLPTTDTVFDVACDAALTRYAFASSTLTQINQLTTPSPVLNLLEFAGHNYLLLTYASVLHVVKRSDYQFQSIVDSGLPFTANPFSIACCEYDLHKFTFSAVSTDAVPQFVIYKVNLDFCSAYDGETCLECASGYKLSSSDLGNTCITPDEFPPVHGAKGGGIAKCQDNNCERCINAFDVCEVCRSPYFITVDSYNCSDLAVIFRFGRDLANASLIRECVDQNCLYCKDDHARCLVCQEEYFDLRDGACVAKESDIGIRASWFNESESKAYIQLNQSFWANPKALYPLNLSLQILDSQNDTYQDFDNFQISGDPATGLIVVSLDLHTSIYNGRIRFTQTAKTPVFYNQGSYMPTTIELVVSNIRQIHAKTYFFLESIEKIILWPLWAVMLATFTLGVVDNPIFGSLLMRAISMSNLFSHLNGPALHTADMFLDITGKTSIPFPIFEQLLQESESFESPCVPGENFRRRYKAEVSCSIVNLYGESILFFCCAALACLPISVVALLKLKALKNGWKKDARRPVPKTASRWLVASRWYGLRFLAAGVHATAPVFLQYAVLTLTSAGPSVIADVAAGLLLAVYGLLLFGLFRFTHDQLGILEAHDSSAQPAATKDRPVQGKVAEGDGAKLLPVIHPKTLGSVRLKVGGKTTASKALEDSGITSMEEKAKPGDSGLLDDTFLDKPEHLQPANSSEGSIKLDLGIMRNKFGFLHFFLMDYKRQSQMSRTVFYYLPLFDACLTLVYGFVVARFSDDGVGQVYIIALLELVSFGILLIVQPYEKKAAFTAAATFKGLVCLQLLLRLCSFVAMPEERVRQAAVDTASLICGLLLVAFGASVGLLFAVKGLIAFKNFAKAADHEMLVLEQERTEMLAMYPPPKEEIALVQPDPVPEPAPQKEAHKPDELLDLDDVDKIARANKLTEIHKDNIRKVEKLKRSRFDDQPGQPKLESKGLNFLLESIEKKAKEDEESSGNLAHINNEGATEGTPGVQAAVQSQRPQPDAHRVNQVHQSFAKKQKSSAMSTLTHDTSAASGPRHLHPSMLSKKPDLQVEKFSFLLDFDQRSDVTSNGK